MALDDDAAADCAETVLGEDREKMRLRWGATRRKFHKGNCK